MFGITDTLSGYAIVTTLNHRLHGLRGFAIAFVALALSAGLAFGAQPDASAWGLANAAAHAAKTVPVQAGDETTDESTDEDAQESEESSDAGTNCTTDPTTLTAEDLAAMKHGSIVCWAAHQTQWPEWFANHGAFVKCWAHQGKADAPSCTTAPAADASATGHGNGKGKGKDK
jgi:hypothetical protein